MFDLDNIGRITDTALLINIGVICGVKLLDTLDTESVATATPEDLENINNFKSYKSILRVPGNCIVGLLESHAKASRKFRNNLERELIHTISSKNVFVGNHKYANYDLQLLVKNIGKHYDRLTIEGFDIVCLIRDIILADYYKKFDGVFFKDKASIINTSIVEAPKVDCGYDTYAVSALFLSYYHDDAINIIEVTYEKLLSLHRYIERLYEKLKNICDNEDVLDAIKILIANFREAITFKKSLDIDCSRFADKDKVLADRYNRIHLDNVIEKCNNSIAQESKWEE